MKYLTDIAGKAQKAIGTGVEEAKKTEPKKIEKPPIAAARDSRGATALRAGAETALAARESNNSMVRGRSPPGAGEARGAEAHEAANVTAHAARKATAVCFIGSPPRKTEVVRLQYIPYGTSWKRR